ncbi:FecR family protein [Roseivirga echinicomitans]
MKHNDPIEDWFYTKTFDQDQREELEKAIAFSANLAVPLGKNENQAWDQILGKIEAESEDKVRFIIPKKETASYWLAWASGIAAMLIAAYLAFYNPLGQGEIVQSRAELGEIEKVVLPSGSKLTLNSSSTSSYNAQTWYGKRIIQLEGEAFFEVTKGVEFTVETDNGTVQVLGTSFNVFSRGKEFSVECSTGSVLVSSNNQQVELKPGQKAYINGENLLLSEFNLDKVATWRIGDFYFDATPLKKVIEEMERQFDIKIRMKADITERYYSGFFSRTNLKEALQLVFIPMGLDFKINDKEVTVQ